MEAARIVRKKQKTGVVLFYLLCFFVLISFTKFHESPTYHLINSALTVLLFLVWVVKYITHKTKLTSINIVSFVYLTYIYGYSLYIGTLQGFSDPFVIITLILFICYAFRFHQGELFTAALIFYLFFSVWQLYLEVAYSYVDEFEVTANWLVENKNVVVRYFLPGMMFVLLNATKNNFSLINPKVIIPLVLMTSTILLSTSVTGIVGVIFFILLIIFFWKKTPIWLTINLFLIITIGLFLLLLFFNMQERFGQVLALFGKNDTLSGRTEVWFFALADFFRNPIWGNGVGSFIEGTGPLLEIHHAHNYWLETLRTTGIIGAAVLLGMYVLASNNFKKQNNKTASTKLLVYTVIAFLVMGIDESLTSAYMLIPILNLSSINNYKLQ